MEIVFMGTGTSQGVPMIACDCAVCRSSDPRNRRSRTSVHVVMGGVHIQVDAAPEFREQCIRNAIPEVDLFILTHGHADHVLGMDDMRRYCDRRAGEGIPVYSTPQGLDRIRSIYPYAIGSKPTFRGYPAFVLHEMPPILDLGVGTISTAILPHGRVEVLGLVFEERATGARFAYFTDCKEVGSGGAQTRPGSSGRGAGRIAPGASSHPYVDRRSLCHGRDHRSAQHLPHPLDAHR